jgi:hypothetical protein
MVIVAGFRNPIFRGSKFAQLAQTSGKLGFGYLSRQDAKSAKFGIMNFLCGLCAFARDIPTFGCGIAALGLARLDDA